VTGASGTIGKEILGVLLRRGMRVVAASRSVSRLEKLLNDHYPTYAGQILIHETDVRNAEEVRDMVEFAASAGRIQLLINGAGSYGSIGLVRDVPPVEWKNALETNLYGAYNCTYFTLRHLIPLGAGSIVNIAGGGSTGPLQNLSSYAVSKAGMVRLTDSLAEEVKSHSIQVNAILPGAIDSPMQDQLLLAGDKAGPWYEKIKVLRDSGDGGISASFTGELIDFLVFGAGKVLTGKLISARYDRFKEWSEEHIREIAGSDMYSVRRLDPSTLRPILGKPGLLKG
jgi:NAD(P)-dependent dehydrogenase (short-subunit alcohol dehydrogenase family)